MSGGRVIECMQGDATWLHERTGRVTASRIADVMATTKKGSESAKRSGYKMELLTEIITGNAADHYVSPAMDWGITQEPLARATYELGMGVEVERVGMVIHPLIDRASASPDGYVGTDGLVEFKCPNTATHLGYLIEGEVPSEYVPQMLFQMACTGRSWCDFCSYDSRLPDEFAMFTRRLDRDDEIIAEMENEVMRFIAELNAMADKLLKGRTVQRQEPGPMAPVPAVIPDMA